MNVFSLEDLKENKIKGVLTTMYTFTLSVKRGYVSNPKVNHRIHPLVLTQKNLQKAGFFARDIFIEKVLTDTVVLSITVAEPYIKKFHTEISKVEHVNLIKEHTNE